MYFPKLTAPAQRRTTLSSFGGLDLRTPTPEGSFARMENLCGDHAPALSVRRPRGVLTTLTSPHGLAVRDNPVWVDGATLYVNGHAAGVTLTDGPKQLVSMGSYLLIWPDKMYIDTAKLTDFGPLERTLSTAAAVTWEPCRADGGPLACITAAEPPADSANGDCWLDTSGAQPVLRQYADDTWLTVDDACMILRSTGIGDGFAAEDAVEISGCAEAALNGSFVLRTVSADALVVTALAVAGGQDGAVTVSRTVPDMDFVVECGNRLWGCKYGLVDGRSVNEIYASKLGDFRNWRCYAGLATDSYAASRGSDGPFTGAAAYLGGVLFFKEHCIERVYPSAAGAHQVVTVQCDGVKRGSAASLQVVDGTLFYHGVHGFCAFNGSLPTPISQALGDGDWENAAAGSLKGRYWVSAADETGARHLLVYDARRRLWHRQDDLEALAFAPWNGDLLCLAADGRLLTLEGSAGAAETGSLPFLAETGDLGLREPHSGYLRRLTVSAALGAGAALSAALSYDGGLTWESQGAVTGRGGPERTLLHLRPRRCERVRLKLCGTGDVKVFALSAVYEKGSDGP